MARQPIPGSIYCEKSKGSTKLIIKLRIPGERDQKGRPKYFKVHTGLDNTARGRRAAEQLHRQLYESLHLNSQQNDLLTQILQKLQQQSAPQPLVVADTAVLTAGNQILPVHGIPDGAQFRDAPSVDYRQDGHNLPEQYYSPVSHSDAVPQQKRLITIREAWDEFVSYKDLMPKTLRGYKDAFEVITRGEDYPLTVERVESDVRFFKKEYAPAHHFKPVSINSYLTQFQVFLNWCTKHLYIPKTNFKTEYKAKDRSVSTVKIFTPEELTIMFKDLRQYEPLFALICEVMWETGARPVDILTLVREQFTGSTVKWLNKITKKPEERPVSQRAQELLGEAIQRAGEDNKIFPWQHSSLPYLTDKLNDCLERCKIPKNGRSLKHFRTSFKNRIRKMPFEVQMWLMRHSSAEVTLGNYTYFNNEVFEDDIAGLPTIETMLAAAKGSTANEPVTPSGVRQPNEQVAQDETSTVVEQHNEEAIAEAESKPLGQGETGVYLQPVSQHTRNSAPTYT